MRSAMRSSARERSAAEVRPQASAALWAASRARSTSSWVERATVQITRPSIGEMFSNVCPRVAATQPPPMKLS